MEDANYLVLKILKMLYILWITGLKFVVSQVVYEIIFSISFLYHTTVYAIKTKEKNHRYHLHFLDKS